VRAEHAHEYFLNGSSFDRMAEFIHLKRCCWARHGCV
jgi:hypothetical protein